MYIFREGPKGPLGPMGRLNRLLSFVRRTNTGLTPLVVLTGVSELCCMHLSTKCTFFLPRFDYRMNGVIISFIHVMLLWGKGATECVEKLLKATITCSICTQSDEHILTHSFPV